MTGWAAFAITLVMVLCTIAICMMLTCVVNELKHFRDSMKGDMGSLINRVFLIHKNGVNQGDDYV